MKRKLLRTAAFVRAAKRFAKMHPGKLESFREALSLLELEAFDPRLRTHKLQGELAGKWSANAGYDLRIVFEIVRHENEEAVLLLALGTHNEVY